MSSSSPRYHRKAAAIVELAVCLPTVILLVLGAIEGSRALTVQHTLQEVAQTTCRLYSIKDMPLQDAIDVATQALSAAGINEYSIVYDPSTKDAIDVNLEPVTVTVSVDFTDVAWLPPGFLSAASITGSCTMPADLGQQGGDSSGTYDPPSDDHDGDGNERFDDPSGGDDDD